MEALWRNEVLLGGFGELIVEIVSRKIPREVAEKGKNEGNARYVHNMDTLEETTGRKPRTRSVRKEEMRKAKRRERRERSRKGLSPSEARRE